MGQDRSAALSTSLRQLGRDEMNLAEFPITLLTDRVPKDQQEAVYKDEIYDDRTKRTLSRKLTISAGNYGLTTAVDDEIILALIQLTREKGGFTSRKVEFSRSDLIDRLGWARNGLSYDRILLSLQRWTSVYLQYDNAWRDNRTKTWKTAGFHIIDGFELNDSRANDEQESELLPAMSFIIWNDTIFESFQAGYLKPLDYDLCMGLQNSTAKRMYRFLDKRFYHKPDWTFPLREFAHEHLGLSRKYEGPAHLKRKLNPAIRNLEEVGFLVPMEESERILKDGRDWTIRFVQQVAEGEQGRPPGPEKNQPLPIRDLLPDRSLVEELVARGVTRRTAEELAAGYTAEMIRVKIEVFDWILDCDHERIASNPAGYLVASIYQDYSIPKGFQTRAEREAAEAARQQREAEKQAELRRKHRERREEELIRNYWESLSPEARAEVDAEAEAEIPESNRRSIAEARSKRVAEAMAQMALSISRDAVLRRRLKAEGILPAVAE